MGELPHNPEAYIADLEHLIKRLESDVEHWKRVALDPSVALEANEDGSTSMRVRHAMVTHLVEAFAETLGEAPNYVSASFTSPVQGRIVVTIQRERGKAPYELAEEYRARLEAMGVTDLAPLPPVPEKHNPNPVDSPHIFLNAATQQFECRNCGGAAPCPEETTASRWGDLCRAFEDLHRECKPEAE
jgi:hypothetical protein